MTRALLPVLAAALLGACVPSGGTTRVSSSAEAIAVQRMRFAAEAVCLNNVTRGAQDRAARMLDFPVRERDGGAVVYVNPGTLTILRLGPVPPQTIETAEGRIVEYSGSGCSVGSPVVDISRANRITGEILAPRLVDGSALTASPVGAGQNARGGLGFFFDEVALTQPIVETTITDPASGQVRTFLHPVILVIHR